MYGKEIKKIRLQNGYTQQELSKAIGIPQNTISWIENDKGIENISQCVQLADFYGISLDELIGREILGTKPYCKNYVNQINNSGNGNVNFS